jgi:hypothetical protein
MPQKVRSQRFTKSTKHSSYLGHQVKSDCFNTKTESKEIASEASGPAKQSTTGHPMNPEASKSSVILENVEDEVSSKDDTNEDPRSSGEVLPETGSTSPQPILNIEEHTRSKWPKPLNTKQYDRFFGPPPRRGVTRALKNDEAKQQWEAKVIGYDTRIVGWLNQLPIETLLNVQTNCEEFSSFQNAEVVPRHWIPAKIDGHSPQEWWYFHTNEIPKLLNYPDPNSKPWWNRYNTRVSPFIYPLPDLRTVLFRADYNYHMVDDEVHREHKIYGPRGILKIWKPERRSDIDMSRLHASEQHHDLSKMKQKGLLVPHPTSTPLQPDVNFLIRPYTPNDAAGVSEVLNWEILHGFTTDHYERQDKQSVHTWVKDSVAAGLPCLIAVSNPPRASHRGEKLPINQRVLGFAIAEE